MAAEGVSILGEDSQNNQKSHKGVRIVLEESESIRIISEQSPNNLGTIKSHNSRNFFLILFNISP